MSHHRQHNPSLTGGQPPRGGPPPPPPPPGQGGGGGGHSNGKGKGKGNGGFDHSRHGRWADMAETSIRNALMQRGVDPNLALKYADGILQHPGVSIGQKGEVRYKGKTYDPTTFASSTLADLLTGVTAQKQNQAAIMSEPGYLQDQAELALQRDTQQSALDDQKRRALLNFGDPRYISDPTLAAEAAANPFSLNRALALQDQQQQAATQQAANRSGTLFGGGYQSGLQQAGRVNASALTSATQSLQDVLSGLGQQGAGLQSAYGVGNQRALLDATQRLESQGLLHAAQPPLLGAGRFHFYGPSAGGGGGGGPAKSGPARAPHQTRYPRQRPPIGGKV